jgi:hypothetical protein
MTPTLERCVVVDDGEIDEHQPGFFGNRHLRQQIVNASIDRLRDVLIDVEVIVLIKVAKLAGMRYPVTRREQKAKEINGNPAEFHQCVNAYRT